jgi:hypothetical protein
MTQSCKITSSKLHKQIFSTEMLSFFLKTGKTRSKSKLKLQLEGHITFKRHSKSVNITIYK